MKKVIVTGGSGFIGSAFIRNVIKKTSLEILNIDKLSYASSFQSLKDISDSKRYKFLKLDLKNKKFLQQTFYEFKPDAVIHLAAETHVDRSIKDSKPFLESNIIGTYNLLECARNYWSNLEVKKMKNFRFHHVSTDEVFGDLSNQEQFFDENTPYNPSSPYSASKASSDFLVKSWGRTFNLPVIISNCSNNYGPYQFPEKLIPLMILNALQEKKLPIYGNGRQIRDWLYVDDHVDALYEILTRAEPNTNYVIGGNSEFQNITVVNMICKYLDQLKPSKKFKYNELITFVEDRKGHDYRYAIDPSLIKSKLGWYPKETFETGLKKTISWYLKNTNWCM
jgi:dTDP-glucose 4,6-dehydratase